MNNEQTVKEDRHDKPVTIIVNSRPKTWAEKKISFAQVVELAFPGKQAGPDSSFTVTYRKGEDKKKEGTLVDGESVNVKDGMVFDVTATNRS